MKRSTIELNMSSKGYLRRKTKHVRASKQTRYHTCHWPGCETQVPPAKWGCRFHWFSLPARIRTAIWSAYEPGQEDRLDPSAKYLRAVQDARDWILGHLLNQSDLGERDEDPSPEKKRRD